MGDMSCGYCSMNNHNLSQHYCDDNNGDMSIGYDFINSHTLYQCEYSSALKEMDGDV